MKRKMRWVVWACFLVSIVFILTLGLSSQKPAASLVESPPEDSIQPEHLAGPLEKLSQEMIFAHKAHYGDGDLEHRYFTEESENHEKIEALRNEFVSLHSFSGAIDKHARRRESLSKLAKDAVAIKLAERVFEDFEWVQKQFHQDQAVIRIYAIELLKMRAMLGDFAPLERAAQNLAKKLASDPNEWQKGREHDLRDLAGALVQVEGRERILADVPSFFARVGYESSLKQVFGHVIASYLYRSSSDDEVDKAFMPFWNESNKKES